VRLRTAAEDDLVCASSSLLVPFLHAAVLEIPSGVPMDGERRKSHPEGRKEPHGQLPRRPEDRPKRKEPPPPLCRDLRSLTLDDAKRLLLEPKGSRDRSIWRHLSECEACLEFWEQTFGPTLDADPDFSKALAARQQRHDDIDALLRSLPDFVWEDVAASLATSEPAGAREPAAAGNAPAAPAAAREATTSSKDEIDFAALAAECARFAARAGKTAPELYLEYVHEIHVQSFKDADWTRHGLATLGGVRTRGPALAGAERRAAAGEPVVFPPDVLGSDETWFFFPCPNPDCQAPGEYNPVHRDVILALPPRIQKRSDGKCLLTFALPCQICHEPMTVELDLCDDAAFFGRLAKRAREVVGGFSDWVKRGLERLTRSQELAGEEPKVKVRVDAQSKPRTE
jgi:hypothetical protein